MTLFFLLLALLYIAIVTRGFSRWPSDWFPAVRASDYDSLTPAQRKKMMWGNALGMLVVGVILYATFYYLKI